MSILVNKNPCHRDCPKRRPGCGSNCKEWAKWHEALEAEKQSMKKQCQISAYQVEVIKKKERGYTRLGYKVKGSQC